MSFTIDQRKDFFNLLFKCAKHILRYLNASQDKPVTALLCSESIELLPVTTAVKIAVDIADRGNNCLLIDADTTRNAVYKVFDVGEKTCAEPIQSCIENLSVWSVSKNCETVGSDLALKISEAVNKFEYILIYAPQIKNSNYYGKLAGLVNVAGFATGETNSDEKYIVQLKELLSSVDCRCIVSKSMA